MPFTLLVVSGNAFFPFISTKNFLFRGLVEIAAAGWIGLLFINPRSYWPRRSLVFIAFGILIGAAFLATIFSTDPSYSFWSNYERMEGFIGYIHLFLLFLTLAGLFHRRKDWFILFGISIGVSAIMSFYGLLEYFGAIATFSDSARIIATLGNPLYVAAYLTFHIFLLAYLFFQTRSKALRVFYVALILLELSAFFLTGSRGAFVGILGGFGLMIFLSFFLVKEKKRKAIIALIMLAMILALIGLTFMKDVPFIRNNDVLARFSRISSTDTTASSRFIIWEMAVKSFLQRPILGWGLNNFIIPFAFNYDPRIFGNEPWFDRTHNMPLEWLVSTGIVGFGSYLFLIIAMFWALLRAAKRKVIENKDAVIFFGMIIAYLFQMLFVFDVLATHLMLVVILGFLAVASSHTREEWYEKRHGTVPRKISGAVMMGTVGAFFAVFIAMYFVNIKPYRASTALIDAFRSIGEGKNDEALARFDRALSLSQNTIGQSEVREHLARLASDGLAVNPQLINNTQIQAFYKRAIDEMKKEVAGYKDDYPGVRFEVMLGRLYGVWGAVSGDDALVQEAVNIYNEAISFAPDHIPLYVFIADFHVQLRQYDTGLKLIREAENKLDAYGKYSFEVSYNLPFIYIIAEDYENALKETKRLQAKLGGELFNLDTTKMNVILGVAKRNDSPGGWQYIEDVFHLDNRVTAAGLLLAERYVNAGQYERAREIAQIIRERNIEPDFEKDINSLWEVLDSLE
ncbi:MAG: O-antigen ligase family protein [Candidatus Niyogibacteria bacterium]|nr:O-antigen ligase family protein [Candidatus Niyogibacteria bacterium]